jgi:putative salt-induced outer membrane protein YdiY
VAQRLWKWDDVRRAEWKIDLSAILNKSRPTNRFAVGTTTNYSVGRPPKETNAERYFVGSRYGQTFTKRTAWYVEASWMRNLPTGVQNQWIGSAGIANIWFLEKEDMSFVTTYGLTYTNEDLTVGPRNDFAGGRLSYDYDNAFTKTASFLSDLIIDLNFDTSSDWRANFYSAVQVAIGKKMALKAGLRLLYRNDPVLEELPLFNAAGVLQPQTVLEPREELDTEFTTSLVINFM